MKYLITGSCGFVFSNVVIYLLQHTSDDIASIDGLYSGSLFNVPTKVKRHNLYMGDICNYDFVRRVYEIEQPDIIIHGATEGRTDGSMVYSNVVGAHNLLEAALKIHMPQKFINVSGYEVYGSVEAPAKETNTLRPTNPYSVTKAAADLLGQSYFTTYDLPIITVRPSNIYGPRQHLEKLIPKAVSSILGCNKISLYGSGNNIRSWIYVKDFFRALQVIIEKGSVGEVYNIGAGMEKENIVILKLVLEIMNADESFIKGVEDIKGNDFRHSIDCTKLGALGWTPKYEFAEALEYVINWMKANPWSLNR